LAKGLTSLSRSGIPQTYLGIAWFIAATRGKAVRFRGFILFSLFIGAFVNSFSWKCMSVLALALVMVGCGPGGPTLYKAGGTVTYKDKPVPDATVTFQYADGNSASGTTDAAGKFSLAYLGNPKGAAAGTCKVSVVKTEAKASMAPPISDASKSRDPAEMMKLMQKAGGDNLKNPEGKVGGVAAGKNELPAKYGNFTTSGLSHEITTDEKKNDFSIVLTD
jgi:hypothetical protein